MTSYAPGFEPGGPFNPSGVDPFITPRRPGDRPGPRNNPRGPFDPTRLPWLGGPPISNPRIRPPVGDPVRPVIPWYQNQPEPADLGYEGIGGQHVKQDMLDRMSTLPENWESLFEESGVGLAGKDQLGELYSPQEAEKMRRLETVRYMDRKEAVPSIYGPQGGGTQVAQRQRAVGQQRAQAENDRQISQVLQGGRASTPSFTPPVYGGRGGTTMAAAPRTGGVKAVRPGGTPSPRSRLRRPKGITPISPSIKGFAQGGTIKKGTTGVVGEKGPEFVTDTPDGAEVTPIQVGPNEFGGFNPITARGYGDRADRTSIIERGRLQPRTFRIQGPIPDSKIDASNLSPEEWIAAMQRDVESQKGAIEERKSNELAALGQLDRALEGIGGGRRLVDDIYQARAEQIERARRAGTEALTAGGEKADKALGGVQKAASRATGAVSKAAGELTTQGKQQLLDVKGMVGAQREEGIAAGQDIYSALSQSGENIVREGLERFKNMTAGDISVQREAIDANFRQRKEQALATATNDAERQRISFQMDMEHSGQVSQMSRQITSAWNAKSADLHRDLTSIYSNMATTGASLLTQIRGLEDQVAATAVTTACGQALQATGVGVGAIANIEGAALQTQTQAQVAVAQMHTNLSKYTADLWQNLGLQDGENAKLRAQWEMDLQNLELTGNTLMAENIRNLTTDFAMESPMFSHILNYWIQRETLNKLNRFGGAA